jgi:hypothetical protein
MFEMCMDIDWDFKMYGDFHDWISLAIWALGVIVWEFMVRVVPLPF